MEALRCGIREKFERWPGTWGESEGERGRLAPLVAVGTATGVERGSTSTSIVATRRGAAGAEGRLEITGCEAGTVVEADGRLEALEMFPECIAPSDGVSTGSAAGAAPEFDKRWILLMREIERSRQSSRSFLFSCLRVHLVATEIDLSRRSSGRTVVLM